MSLHYFVGGGQVPVYLTSFGEKKEWTYLAKFSRDAVGLQPIETDSIGS